MNPNVIRYKLQKCIGQKVNIKVYGMRNKNNFYSGIIKSIYPQIFSVETCEGIKSFSYSEIINGEVEIEFF